MNNPKTFYNQQLKEHGQELKKLNKLLVQSGVLRLALFVVIVLVDYLFFEYLNAILAFSVLAIALFLYLVKRHENLKSQKKFTEQLIKINQLELKVLDGEFSALPSGENYLDQQHDFAYDLDLFGEASFFQYLNRTSTKEGEALLANNFLANNIHNIDSKQLALKELANLPKWRQHFGAKAKMIEIEYPLSKVLDWLKNHTVFLTPFWVWLSRLFGVVSVVLIILSVLKLISPTYMGLWLCLGLIFTGRHFKNINLTYQKANASKSVFKQYAQLLNLIESQEFNSILLKEQQNLIKTQQLKASQILFKFSRILDAFDQRNNLIIALLGNGLFLRDLLIVNKIDQWLKLHHQTVETWFNAVSFFDAQNSLANYVFNHSDHNFPILTNQKEVIDAKELGHPLIPQNKRVNNQFNIKNNEFYIITGANMAGKSTFLRTVSLSIVMANMGLPVCAKQMNYKPCKLITSMRATDSLSEETSYFFSELKRLKHLVNAIQQDHYFIILDEILKGTNSKDKAIGSQKFVEKLVMAQSTGIIATHDLSLCELSNQLSEVKNWFFDAQIVDDELYFDYQLKEGICQNMNASFLLKKMKIIDA